MSTGSVEELTPAPKKRKQRGDNVDIKEDSDLGPSGGAKHWTDEEKSRLFHWMLTDDNRWEAFGSKMNTIFREVGRHSVVLSCTLIYDCLLPGIRGIVRLEEDVHRPQIVLSPEFRRVQADICI